MRQLPYSHHITLTTLPQQAIAALAANHLNVSPDALPAVLIELIESRAEGNPFFAKELLLHLQAQKAIQVKAAPHNDQALCHLGKTLLEKQDFLFIEALEPERLYAFQHIIIREVAYNALLYEQKRRLHKILAVWYEALYQEQSKNSAWLPLLVYHIDSTGLVLISPSPFWIAPGHNTEYVLIQNAVGRG